MLVVDKILEKNFVTAAAVHIWKELAKHLMREKFDKTCMKSFSYLYKQALGHHKSQDSQLPLATWRLSFEKWQ